MKLKIFCVICLVVLTVWGITELNARPLVIHGRGHTYARYDGQGSIEFGCDNFDPTECYIEIEQPAQ